MLYVMFTMHRSRFDMFHVDTQESGDARNGRLSASTVWTALSDVHIVFTNLYVRRLLGPLQYFLSWDLHLERNANQKNNGKNNKKQKNKKSIQGYFQEY